MPRTTILLILTLTALSTAAGSRAGNEYRPTIRPANFKSAIDNSYFPLARGTTWTYVEKSGKHTTDIESEVTHDTKVVMGVTCTVVHTTVREKGQLREETFAWYAQDKDGNVWYFGEDAKEFHSGGKVSTEGSWVAGEGQNQPGIVMPGNPARGGDYRQSYVPGEEEDMGRIVASSESVTVALGTMSNCLRTKEWSLLSAGSEKKWYAPKIGCVKEISPEGDVTELVSMRHAGDE